MHVSGISILSWKHRRCPSTAGLAERGKEPRITQGMEKMFLCRWNVRCANQLTTWWLSSRHFFCGLAHHLCFLYGASTISYDSVGLGQGWGVGLGQGWSDCHSCNEQMMPSKPLMVKFSGWRDLLFFFFFQQRRCQFWVLGQSLLWIKYASTCDTGLSILFWYTGTTKRVLSLFFFLRFSWHA